MKLLKIDHVLDYEALEYLITQYSLIPGVDVEEHKIKSGRHIYNLTYGEGDKKLISVCGLHANERSAIQFFGTSLNYVIENGLPKGVKYSIVSPANPDGMVYNTRGNESHSDLNRDWDNFSQLETRIIKNIIDEENKDSQVILLDHHECHNDPLYFLEDRASKNKKETRGIFFEELYKERDEHNLPMSNFWLGFTNKHTHEASRCGQLINYSAAKGIFSLIVENRGQQFGNNLIEERMQVHASTDLAALRTLGNLKELK